MVGLVLTRLIGTDEITGEITTIEGHKLYYSFNKLIDDDMKYGRDNKRAYQLLRTLTKTSPRSISIKKIIMENH